MPNSNQLSLLAQEIEQLKAEKKQLLKLVSHDVKSPFNKLYALSNLLQLTSDNLNEDQLDLLTRMEWVVKEGLTVVRNLLDLRAIDNASVEIAVEKVNLTALVVETIKAYEKQASAKNINIETKLYNVTTQSDRRLMERVVDHLMSNAIKFTRKEKAISIKLEAIGAGYALEISSDSGPIPSEEVKNLFVRGTTLSTRPTHGENALGNGLFIAQTYAKKLNASIDFDQNDEKVTFGLKA